MAITITANTYDEMRRNCLEFLGLDDSTYLKSLSGSLPTLSLNEEIPNSLQPEVPVSPLQEEFSDVLFSDLISTEEQLKSFSSIVDLLKNHKKYMERRVEIPKGVILYGEDTDELYKITLAIANEAGAAKITISKALYNHDIITAANTISSVFEIALEASRKTPVVIIWEQFDEYTSLLMPTMANSVKVRFNEQITNHLLDQLDAISNNSTEGYPIIIIANAKSIFNIKSEVFEPGYFNRQIYIERPSLELRIKILENAFIEENLAEDISIEKIAKRIAGMTVSDIYELVNEIKIEAVKNNESDIITSKNINETISYFDFGQKIEIADPETLKATAVHEAGHAIIAILYGMNLTELSIITQLDAAGYTSYNGEIREREIANWNSCLNSIKVSLAGKAAEEIVYGISSVGVVSDLQHATVIACNGVTFLGMSDVLGPIDLYHSYYLAEASKEDVYREVQKILKESLEEVKKLIVKYEVQFTALWKELLKKHYLTIDEALEVVGKDLEGAEKAKNI